MTLSFSTRRTYHPAGLPGHFTGSGRVSGASRARSSATSAGSAGDHAARPIDKLRVEHARTLLAAGDVSAKALAAQCGFGNPTRMKRAFERELGIGPREYRVLHARSPGA
jgi:AraC-like DNA-binding protein